MGIRFYLWRLVCISTFLGFVGCDCKNDTELRRSCTEPVAPTGCGDDCTLISCASGLYCADDQACSFDCIPGDGTCGEGQVCSAVGQCVAAEDGGIEDSAVADGGLDGGERDSAATGMDACATIALEADPTTPNIMLLVDRSSSMNDDLVNTGGSNNDEESRWDALERVVFANNGAIAATAGSVRYGISLYSRIGAEVACGDDGCPMNMCLGNQSNCPGSGDCLRCPSPSCLFEGSEQASAIIRVAPALDQFATVRQPLLDFNPQGGTPTGDAIDFIRPDLEALAQSTGEPTLIILATDGEPDRCEDNDEGRNRGLGTDFDGNGVLDGMEESLVAAEAAFDAGIRTFVISLSADVDNDHLQQMANIGQGLAQFEPDATEARFYLADDSAELQNAIEEIIGDQVSCELTLSSPISAANACDGEVLYEGEPLSCQPADQNGWFPGTPTIDGSTSTIELRGTACETFQRDGGEISGAFPCFVVII